ncbi:sirohydrochlorin cobaltochelatase [Rhodospirillales bacterium]|nr:sirohydrochlorin cobaltochelatase [Rhodospirillales bacterium]
MSSDSKVPKQSNTALVLAAHGSSRRPEANALVDAHAASIGAKNIFSSVHTVFLMGGADPLDVIQDVTAQYIIVVPFMMSDGYLVDVIAEKLNAAISSDNTRDMHVSDPIGTHPEIASIAADMAESMLIENKLTPMDATVVLVAHGTKQRPESKAGAMHHLESVKSMKRFADVRLALLEEAPFVDDVLKEISGPSAIVGMFAAPGDHAIDDVQDAMAKNSRSDMLNTGPIGANSRMINIVIDRALSKIS